MKVGQFKKTLLTLAVAAAGFYTTGALAQGNDNMGSAADITPTQAQVNALTRVALQEWVQGLQKAFPYFQLDLKKVEPVGGFVHGVVGLSIGYDTGYRDYGMQDDVLVNVKPELTLVNGKVSLGRLSIDIDENGAFDGLGNASDYASGYGFNEELQDLLEKFPHELNAFVRPSGNIYAEFLSTGPLVIDEGYGDVLSIPSFSLVMQSYNNKELLKVEGSIPFIEFSEDGEKVFEAKNITLGSKGHAIKNGYFDLNGGTDFQVESATVYDIGENNLARGTLSNLKVFTDTKVDAKGLYQGDFASSFKLKIAKDTVALKLPIEDIVFDMKGDMSKLHADSYMKLLNLVLNTPYDEIPPKEMEALLLEMAKQSPEMNFTKVTATLNGHQGNMTLNVSVQPISKEEEESNIYLLLLQKTRGDMTIDFPVEWLSLIGPDEDPKELLERMLEDTNGFLILEKNRLKSNISYIGGNLKVNGKIIDYRDYVPFL